MIWETYQNAYQSATPEIRELLDSDKIPMCVKSSLMNRGLLALRRVSVMEVSSYIIGIQTIDETMKNLVQAGIPDALQFLAEVQTNINQPTAPLAATTPPATQNLASEISAAEHDLASLHSVRTMSHDMAAIRPGSDVVYQSSQADILRAPAPVFTPPAPEAPRWDTDTRK